MPISPFLRKEVFFILANETIQIQWSPRNRKYYESKGYTFTNYKDILEIKISDLSNGSDIMVPVRCDYCGKISFVSYNTYLERHKKFPKDSCKECVGKKNRESSLINRATKAFNKLTKLCEQLNYTLLTSATEYTGIKMIIEYLCPIHGKQTSCLNDFLNGHYCKFCSYDNLANKRRYSPSFVKEYIESKNNNKLLNPNDYTDIWNENLKIQCNCSRIYTVSFRGYKKDNKQRCPQCSHAISQPELRIMNYLEKLNINYIYQKTYDDCKDKSLLPFDFYLPYYNLIIEYDGEQHFYPIYGKEIFLLTQKHDVMKNQYCIENDIDLLRILYTQLDNIEQIIESEIGKRYSLIS